MQNFIYPLLLIAFLAGELTAQTPGKETIIIETSYGTMKVKLYEETPFHKKNFLKLVETKFFDSLLFHRVINNFMIQGGDPLSKNAKSGDSLGHGDIGYTVPAEFNEKLIHQKGRLCAARESDDINPLQASSASQFYIVMGKKRTSEDLKKYEDRINKTYYTNCSRQFMRSEKGKEISKKQERLKRENKTDSVTLLSNEMEVEIKKLYQARPEYKFNKMQTDVYLNIGGTPHLDGTYTVFGEVIEGLEVIDKIAQVKTDSRDRPIEDVRMKVRIIK